MSLISTTVRIAVKLGHALAPAATSRRLATMFLTPRRPKRPRAPVAGGGLQAAHSTVRSGEHEIATWAWGEGPAILLVHGWAGRSTQLEGFVEPLVRAGHRVVAMDLPAHGLSTGKSTNLVRAARAIRDVAQAQSPGPSTFHGAVAHSFGGIALLVAQLETKVAERLVGVAPAVEPKLFMDQMLDFLQVPAGRRGAVYGGVEAIVGRRMEELDLREKAGATGTPLLALHDPQDAEVPFAHGEAWAKVSREGELVAVEGAGHRRILKDPAVIARACAFVIGKPAEAASAPVPAPGLAEALLGTGARTLPVPAPSVPR